MQVPVQDHTIPFTTNENPLFHTPSYWFDTCLSSSLLNFPIFSIHLHYKAKNHTMRSQNYWSYQFVIVSEIIHDWVPQRMQGVNAVFWCDVKHVSALVATWKFEIHTAYCVQGLVNIANIVNQESQCVWTCSCFIVIVDFYHSFVNKAILIICMFKKPVDDALLYNCDIFGIALKIWVIFFISDPCSCVKVPHWLPSTTFVFYIICEGCSFYKWIAHFTLGYWIHTHDIQPLIRFLQSLRRLLSQIIIRYSCNYNSELNTIKYFT